MEFALQKTLYAPEVKNIRKSLNMKQKELAVLLNVSVKTVEHWESSGGSVSGAAAPGFRKNWRSRKRSFRCASDI